MTKNTCSASECERPVLARGLCGTHYARARRARTLPPKQRSSFPRPCAVERCGRSANARGWCELHYRRWLHHGDPLTSGSRVIGDDEARFWSRVTKGANPEDCWAWMGSHTTAGYGSGRWAGRAEYAHRIAYRLFVGPIPEGCELDHLCRNRGCCNPTHLEAVSHHANIQRAYALRTQCPQGHAYDEANTYVDALGHRKCRACRREGMRRRESTG